MKKVKITIIKKYYDTELAEKYAIPALGICPVHQVGESFLSVDGRQPEGLCDFAWLPIRECVGQLARGELIQPAAPGCGMTARGYLPIRISIGVRPVIMLVEAMED